MINKLLFPVWIVALLSVPQARAQESISKGSPELSCLKASVQVFDRPAYVKCWDRCGGSYGYGKCPQISDTPGTKPEHFCHGDPGRTICTSWITDWPITYLSAPQEQALDASEIPPCLQKQIDEIKTQHVWNPPAQINEYVYKGKTTYLASSDCCDQFQPLYDAECRMICSPGGGFSGHGDGKCPDFEEDAAFVRLIWKDRR